MANQVLFFELLGETAIFKKMQSEVVAGFRNIRQEHQRMTAGMVEQDRLFEQAEAAAAKAAEMRALKQAAVGRARGGYGSQETQALRQEALALDQAMNVSVGGISKWALGLGVAIPIVGGLFMGVGALIEGLEKMTMKVAASSSAILQQSRAIGLTTSDYQKWVSVAEQVGIQQDQFNRVIDYFNRALDRGYLTMSSGKVALKDLGVTGIDATHSIRDTNTALMQMADYMHSTSNTAQVADVAIGAFSRGGYRLIAALDVGSAAIKAYGAELEKFGVILTHDQLIMGAATQVVEKEFQFALKGLENQLAAHLEPAFIQLLTVMTHVTVNGRGLFVALADAVVQVVGFIAGLIAGLTGAVVDFSTASTSAIGPLAGLSGTANEAAPELDKMSNAASGAADNTRALREQMDELRLSTKHRTDTIDDEVRALRDEQTTYDENIRQTNLMRDLQDELHQSRLSALQDELDLERDAGESHMRSGENMVTYRRRLSEMELQNQIKKEENSRKLGKTTQELDSLNFKKATDDKIKALEAQKTALERSTADEEARLQDLMAAMQATSASGIASMGGIGNAISSAGTTGALDFKKAMDSMDKTAFNTAQRIGLAIRGIFGGGNSLDQLAGNLGKSAIQSLEIAMDNALAGLIGSMKIILSFMGGPAAPIIFGGLTLAENALRDTAHRVQGEQDRAKAEAQYKAATEGQAAPPEEPGGTRGGTARSFQSGGHTSMGLAFLHSRETVLPWDHVERSAQLIREIPSLREAATRAMSGRSGGPMFNNVFTGPIATEYVAAAVVDRMAADARRRGLIRAVGVG